MFSFKEWYIKGTKFGSVKALEKIFETVKTLFKFDGTATTGADGTRYLVNAGSGDDIVLKTGANYLSRPEQADGVPLAGLSNSNSMLLRTFIKADTPLDRTRYIGGTAVELDLRWGVTTTDDWAFSVRGTYISVPRNGKDYATIMFAYCKDEVSTFVYIYVDGACINNEGIDVTGLDLNRTGHFVSFINYRSSGSYNVTNSLKAVIGNTWMMYTNSEQNAELTKSAADEIALFDYQNPEKNLIATHSATPYVTSGQPLMASLLANPEAFRWYPMMDFKGGPLRSWEKNLLIDYDVVETTFQTLDMDWQKVSGAAGIDACSDKDYQRALVTLSTEGAVIDSTTVDHLNIEAGSFNDLPESVYNTAKYDFFESGADTVLSFDTDSLPATTNWDADTFYFSPDGSNFTGLGTSESPFRDFSIINDIVSQYSTAYTGNNPSLNIYLMAGEYEAVTLSNFDAINVRIAIDPLATGDVYLGGLKLDNVQNITLDGQTVSGNGYNTKQRVSPTDYGIVINANVGAQDYQNAIVVTGANADNVQILNTTTTTLDSVTDWSDWEFNTEVNYYSGGSSLSGQLSVDYHKYLSRSFDGIRVSAPSLNSPLIVDNNHIEGVGYGIIMSGVDNCIVKNNDISRVHMDYMIIYGCNDLQVLNNYTHDDYHLSGWHIDHVQAYGKVSTNVLIDGHIALAESSPNFWGLSANHNNKRAYNDLISHLDATSAISVSAAASDFGSTESRANCHADERDAIIANGDEVAVLGYTDSNGYWRKKTANGVTEDHVNDEYYGFTAYGSQGIFLESGVINNMVVQNCVSKPSGANWAFACAGTDMQVVNNTFVGATVRMTNIGEGTCIASNNITAAGYGYLATVNNVPYGTAFTDDGTNVRVDELGTSIFVDYTNKDFSLVSNITGDATYAPVTDINGVTRANPPSVGAYEYV
jgi:hypothetical protein